jgi:hypothetical protein
MPSPRPGTDDTANTRWIEVRDSGEIKATIDVGTIIHDADGNAHARVCLTENGVCTFGRTTRWFFNCHNHQYSAIDTTFLPGFPHKMNDAQPNSAADKLSVIACKGFQMPAVRGFWCGAGGRRLKTFIGRNRDEGRYGAIRAGAMGI